MFIQAWPDNGDFVIVDAGPPGIDRNHDGL